MKRRLLYLPLLLLLASPVQAVEPLSDIEGLNEYEQQRYGEAAARFTDPYKRGNAYYRARDYESARDAYTAALGGEKADRAWYNLGNSYFQMQQYDAAIEAYDQVLKERPDDADARFNRDLAEKMRRRQNSSQSPSARPVPSPSQPSPGKESDQQPPDSQDGEGGQQPGEPDGESPPGQQPQPGGQPNQPDPSQNPPDPPQPGNPEEGEHESSGDRPSDSPGDPGQGGGGDDETDNDAPPDDRMLDELTDDPGQLVRNQMRQEEGRQSQRKRLQGTMESDQPW